VEGIYKEIILLAASEKYNNYCIAGIEVETGEWVRIISEDQSIHGAVKKEDMIFEDGTTPSLLDIIRIKCKYHKPNYFQPENYVFDDQYFWEKTGKVTIDDVIRLHPPENRDYIFFDTEKKIHKNCFIELSDSQKYSLIFLEPDSPNVCVKQWPERKNITMNFNYKGNSYRYIAITDLDFLEKYSNFGDGYYPIFNRTFLIMSLGECYNKDNCHYKLIAAVIGT
jgi:hypothetical protein